MINASDCYNFTSFLFIIFLHLFRNCFSKLNWFFFYRKWQTVQLNRDNFACGHTSYLTQYFCCFFLRFRFKSRFIMWEIEINLTFNWQCVKRKVFLLFDSLLIKDTYKKPRCWQTRLCKHLFKHLFTPKKNKKFK